MTRIALLGLLAALPVLSGCPGQPVRVVTACPAIPKDLTADCFINHPVPTVNGELAEQWMDYRACAQEQSIKLKVVASLAECRLKDE